MVLEDGRTVGYDHLVLALGARAKDALPGALTFGGPADVERLRIALEELDGRGGGRVAFVARTSIAWSLPLYELAVLTAASTSCTVALITHERLPLEAFGPEASAEVAAVLADHGIEVHCSTVADRVVDGGVWVPIEGRIDADLVVALPVLVGPDVAGLPNDPLRLRAVDDFCRIAGATGAYPSAT